tara:strand:+ start:155 stop:529 length:375 start_codon:yes stop_codon:yes gene_type:complete
MPAFKVIEGGKSTVFSDPEWEEIRRELLEIEVEIRNQQGDRDAEFAKVTSSHLGVAKRGELYELLSFVPWLSVKEIAASLSISERIIQLTLNRYWALSVYCKRGVMTERGGVKFLWAIEGTLPY